MVPIRRVTLGNTGIETSYLGFGTGTSGYAGRSEQSKLGVEGLARLLLYAKDLGITFWDAAEDYGTHPHLARALSQVKRDEVVVATKTFARKSEELQNVVPRFLAELGTEYIDILLLHCITDAKRSDQLESALDTLIDCKKRGMVRAVGVSCHNLGALQAATGHPKIDVVLARINYDGVHMDASPAEVEPVLAQLHAAGQGVYGMKIYGQGQLTAECRRAMRYAFELGTVDALVLGMKNEAEIEENVALAREVAPVS